MKTTIAATLFAFVTVGVADEKQKAIDPPLYSSEMHRIVQNDKGPRYESKVPIRTLKEQFQEPLIDAKAQAIPETYRFSYFPTIENPWTIRFTVTAENAGELIVKRLSGKGGYDPGKLIFERKSTITGDAFKNLLSMLRIPDVARPYGELTEIQVEILSGLDGTKWYLETRRGQDYRCADVWCADGLNETKKFLLEEKLTVYEKLNPKPFVDACEALIEAAGLKLELVTSKLEENPEAGQAAPSNR